MSNISQKAQEAVDYVAGSLDPYVPAAAKPTAGFVADSAKTAISFASQQMERTMEFGKVVVNGATTTVTAYTPEPVLNLINNTLSGAQALREDPVATVKPYVPTFVIHAGEKTFEIVSHTADSTKRNMEATGGFVVTKVNGVVTAVTNVPVVHSLIEQLQKLTGNLVSGPKDIPQPTEPAKEAEDAAEK